MAIAASMEVRVDSSTKERTQNVQYISSVTPILASHASGVKVTGSDGLNASKSEFNFDCKELLTEPGNDTDEIQYMNW